MFVRKFFLLFVGVVFLAAVWVGPVAAGGLPVCEMPEALAVQPVMLGRAAPLASTLQQTTTVPALDTEEIMESVNEGVAYGFEFATAFTPLITIIIGFAVASAIIGVLFALGPKIARMIKKAL